MLAMGRANRKFLFEIRPDVFPQGFLTDTEIELWGRFLTREK